MKEGQSVAVWEDSGVELTPKGQKKPFWSDENVLYLDCGHDYIVYKCVKTHCNTELNE